MTSKKWLRMLLTGMSGKETRTRAAFAVAEEELNKRGTCFRLAHIAACVSMIATSTVLQGPATILNLLPLLIRKLKWVFCPELELQQCLTLQGKHQKLDCISGPAKISFQLLTVVKRKSLNKKIYMQIEKVSYHKTFNLGNYSNEKIGIDIVLAPGEDPLDAFAEAKKQVEKSHRFFQELPRYEQAQKVVDNPDDYTGREMKAAQDIIKAFEANYPDFISKFIPVSRQLKEAPEEYSYRDED